MPSLRSGTSENLIFPTPKKLSDTKNLSKTKFSLLLELERPPLVAQSCVVAFGKGAQLCKRLKAQGVKFACLGPCAHKIEKSNRKQDLRLYDDARSLWGLSASVARRRFAPARLRGCRSTAALNAALNGGMQASLFFLF